MHDVLQSSAAQLVIGLASLLVLTAIGAFVVLKFRDDGDSTESSSKLLTKFREMRHEGHLNEDEYRTIRTDLEGKLSKQSSSNAVDADGFDLHG